MKKEHIEQIIRELFRQHYNAFPENYPLTGEHINNSIKNKKKEPLVMDETVVNAQEVAKGYWAERNEDEIERDEKAGVSEIDYVEWVMAELSDLIPAAQITSLTQKAANHFLDLYKDDLTDADAQTISNTIHEWWCATEDQYEGVEYEDVKKAIMNKLPDPTSISYKFQTWAAEVNKDWTKPYAATATDNALIVNFDSTEVARIDYNNGRYAVTGSDIDAVASLEYMVAR